MSRLHIAHLTGAIRDAVTGSLVEVEVDLAPGLVSLTLIGASDLAAQQTRERVRAAVRNSNFHWPNRRITLSLRPVELLKQGTSLDVPLALGILVADGQLPAVDSQETLCVGELGLDGAIRPVAGVLAMVLAAAQAGYRYCIVPAHNWDEAALVPDIQALPVRDLAEAGLVLRALAASDQTRSQQWLASQQEGVRHWLTTHPPPPPAVSRGLSNSSVPSVDSHGDLADVLGDHHGRFLLKVAAAGGHHGGMFGLPGVGKTMLLERLGSLLPPLTPAEQCEVAAIAAVLDPQRPLQKLPQRPPVVLPHHSTTVPAMVGGGARVPQLGAITQAHCGVLGLDEAPEFSAEVLNGLRQPLESGFIVLQRAQFQVKLPARFQLFLTANTCACTGRFDQVHQQGCSCTATQKRLYRKRIPAPVLDRLALRYYLPRASNAQLLRRLNQQETSAQASVQVSEARRRAAHRYRNTDTTQDQRTNARIPAPVLLREFPLTHELIDRLEQLQQRHHLSERHIQQLIRVTWSVADLAQRENPGKEQLAQALLLQNVGAGFDPYEQPFREPEAG